LQLPAINWAVLVLTITLVWAAETFNTSIEVMVDLANPDKHPLAKIIKDVSAAGVLITALGSIIVGIILFGPPLWMRISLMLNVGG
jgi:diacylglycerol kinase (ATP)